MKTGDVEKKRLRRTEGYKHKLEESRDKKKEHSPHIPLFLVMSLAVVLLFVGIGVASATDYYVATNGNDFNPGTLNEPWRTIGKANQELQAGDTVNIRGGNYQETIDPSSSGTEGNCITYQNYANEEPIISHPTAHDKCAIYLNDREYIVIDGITVDGYVDGYPDECPSVKRWVSLQGGGHNIIQNCKMQYSGLGWEGFKVYNSHYNKILNNTIRYCGSFDERTWHGATIDDHGDALSLSNSHHNLVEGNDISYGGHDVLRLTGKYNIFRSNYFHNPWEKCLDITQIGETKECKHNLFENNVIAFAYKWNDAKTYPNPGVSCAAIHVIVRNNVFHSNSAEGFWIGNWDTCPYSEGHRIYNNVFYHNGHHNMPEPISHNTYGFWFARWGSYPIVNNVLINNIFWDNNMGSIKWSDVNPTDQIIEHNYEENPSFVNVGNYNFHLKADSPCIDAGRHLTKTVGSGSGTQLAVEDADYFCDGFDIVEGDLIQVGSNSPVRIVNVDYDNSIITVSQSISWNNNDGVSLPYSGSAPDIGAYEYVVDRPTGTISGIVKYISDLFRKIMPPTFLDNLRDVFPL